MKGFSFSNKNSQGLKTAAKELLPYIAKINKQLAKGGYDFWESSINLPYDKKQLDAVLKLAKQYKPKKTEVIVVAGIGGSSLGTLAIWEALRGKCNTKVLFADTLDSQYMLGVIENITEACRNGKDAILVMVSKSGTTTETIANSAVVMNVLKRYNPKAWQKKVIAITDKDSKLWKWAEKNETNKLEIPKMVGGRYSTFSAVGLLPLAIAGINVTDILKGAKKMASECLSVSNTKNPAILSATAIYNNLTKGKIIHDTFIFEPNLESVGKWYRQLTGESLGKKRRGITPTVSIGTNDLHSVAQLYLGGPKDKFTTFITIKNRKNDFKIPSLIIPGLGKQTFNKIMDATLAGVKKAYRKNKLPFAQITLAENSEELLGALMQMKMIEMMYLGKLLNVNAFDQPQIELYKEEVRKILQK